MDTIALWTVISAGILALFVSQLISRRDERHLTHPDNHYRTFRHDSDSHEELRNLYPHKAAIITSLSMRVLISLTVLGCALWIILNADYSDAHQKWAFGIVGTIVGYWLKA